MLKPSAAFAGQEEEKPTGFVSPSDFKAHFANLASDDDFGYKDFFASSQKAQEKEDEGSSAEEGKHAYQTKPGPSYASITAPAQFSYENRGHKRGQATEVHDLTEKPPKIQKHKKNKKQNREESAESDDYNYPSYYKEFVPVSQGKIADYDIGKSSSTVSQNPHSPGFYSKLVQTPKPAISPYQKYSFQPVPAAPILEPQSSNDTPKHLDNKNCKKIDKQITGKDKNGRYKRQSMNCFVCQDPKTKLSFEECSYATNIAPKSYFAQATNKYSNFKAPESFRNKRYSDEEGYVDPYEAVKSQTQTYNSRPKEFDSKHYQPKVAESKDYSYSSGFQQNEKNKKAEPVKSFSERKAEELIKKGENCEKVQREEMTCTVCISEETGGNYEQCSYSSAPAQQKYAYVREQKFDGPAPKGEGKNEGESTSSSEQREEKPQSTNKQEQKRTPYEAEYRRSKQNSSGRDEEPTSSNKKEEKQAPSRPDVSRRGSSRYQVPKHFEDAKVSQEKKSAAGVDSKLYGKDADSSEKVEKKEKKSESQEEEEEEEEKDPYEYPSLSEYHFKYFPEFLKEESKAEESQIVPEKKDVEDVLAEFAKKDRSQCQKAEKNGMTCYLCVDKNGLQHEECMYVSESKPKSTHVAYHEVAEVPAKTESTAGQVATQAKSVEPKAAASNVQPIVVAASEEMIKKIKYQANTPLHEEQDQKTKESKNKKAPKKYKPKKAKEQSTSESRQDEQESTDEKDETEESSEKQSNKESEDDKVTEEEGDKITDVKEPETPEEFQVGETEGAFSEETQPVYSKALGISLPKYMLTKSESEAVFDEFVASIHS